MMKFYTSDICPYAHRVAIALHLVFPKEQEVGKYLQNVEKVHIDLSNKPEWYLKVNPLGKVPALETENKAILIESGIIAEYILDKYGDHHHFYDVKTNTTTKEVDKGNHDVYERKALMKMFASAFGNSVESQFYGLLMARGEEKIHEMKEKLLNSLEKLEIALKESSSGQGPFAFGSQFSLADVLTIPWLVRFSVLKHFRDFEIPSHLTRVNEWVNSCLEQDCVKSTSPSMEMLIAAYSKYAEN